MNRVKLLVILSLVSVLSIAGCASNTTKTIQIDRITPEELAKIMPPPIATVSLEAIVEQTKQGKTPDEIIASIKASNSRYELTPSQTLALSKQGVDVKVLDYIHQSNELAKQNAIADEINKREQAKIIAQKQLEQERRLSRGRFYDDPFYRPYYWGYPYWGSQFYWEPSFYYRRRR